MAFVSSMATKVQSLIEKINQVTQSDDNNLIDAIDTLIKKYEEVSIIIEAVAGEPGSINNPISYNGNMILQADKYYFQDEEVYLCTKSSEVCMYHPLCDLIDDFVQKV